MTDFFASTLDRPLRCRINVDWLDAADTEFAKLKVWQDANSNGVSDPGEVLTLAGHDITRIRLSPDPDSGEQLQHVKINATGVYVTSDGVEHLLGDVSFSHDGSEHHTPPNIP